MEISSLRTLSGGKGMKRGLTILILFCATALAAAAKDSPAIPCQVYFNVISQDRLKNVSQGLSAENAEWFQKKMEKKYPGACYAKPAQSAPIVFFITITPDTYHGTRIVDNTSSHTSESPVTGTIRDEDGNVSHVNGTVETTTTTTSSTAVPYSFEYGIFTLTVERRRSDGKFDTLQTFQQKGLYKTLYGIPLGGRGHHPFHAVIEDATKWVNTSGLADHWQISSQPLGSGTSLQTKNDVGNAESQSTDAAVTQHNIAAIKQQAESGSAAHQWILGYAYYSGQGVPQDYAQAAIWFRKAADEGLAEAQSLLGWLYKNGQGVPKDYLQALVWYRKAADLGNVKAQYNIGCVYKFGQGVPQDYAEAAIWFRKAADQGDAAAQSLLGELYFSGHGVPQDYAEAYFWLDIAASENLTTPDGSLDSYRFIDK
jgi:hypothetical protein